MGSSVVSWGFTNVSWHNTSFFLLFLLLLVVPSWDPPTQSQVLPSSLLPRVSSLLLSNQRLLGIILYSTLVNAMPHGQTAIGSWSTELSIWIPKTKTILTEKKFHILKIIYVIKSSKKGFAWQVCFCFYYCIHLKGMKMLTFKNIA